MRQSGRGRGERIGEAMDEEEVSTIKIGGGGGKHDPHLCLYMLQTQVRIMAGNKPKIWKDIREKKSLIMEGN